ncbi:transposase [Candidatus Poriferisodalis sp.]|uniref:transposase n=1 Tax=Candidatus Poriferisodalis sp. TaxID=3101277 RepID=UPI003C6EF72F
MPAEFRRRVIDLVESGRPVAAVAAELGISGQSIYTWRRQARIDAGVEPGTLFRPSQVGSGVGCQRDRGLRQGHGVVDVVRR